MRLKFTDNEVRLIIDCLSGEENRLHLTRQDLTQGEDHTRNWFEQRVDAVGELKERFKKVRV